MTPATQFVMPLLRIHSLVLVRPQSLAIFAKEILFITIQSIKPVLCQMAKLCVYPGIQMLRAMFAQDASEFRLLLVAVLAYVRLKIVLLAWVELVFGNLPPR